VASLKRSGYFDNPGMAATGSRQWFTGDDSTTVTAEVEVTVDLRQPDAPAFRLTYAATTDGIAEDVRIVGELLTTRPQLGGIRYWFACPRCGRRRRVLYSYPRPGRHRFACRRCHGLRYYSHRESREDRLCRRAKKLWTRAGSEDGSEPWQKPKWMRWETFSRLVLAGRAAQEAGDAIVLGKMGAGLARIIAGRTRRAA
jgi:hypothetical protein